jgi:phosphoenolpyruvate-protein kinase (PTS system EI component)
MADEAIPESIDLRFIARQNARILGELAEMREQTNHIPALRADVSDLRADVSELQHAMAATRADLAIVKDTVEKILETQQNHGARLNVIDGHLAIIEKHTGLVKA